MEIVNLKERKEFIKEYIRLCSKEWGSNVDEKTLEEKINLKEQKILSGNYDNLLSCLLLTDNNNLIGFISLFKTDGEEYQNLTPWYATMYVKKEYRGNNYSKILNDVIINEAKQLGYKKIYLKSALINYYKKFGAKYLTKLNNGENLFYIELL